MGYYIRKDKLYSNTDYYYDNVGNVCKDWVLCDRIFTDIIEERLFAKRLSPKEMQSYLRANPELAQSLGDIKFSKNMNPDDYNRAMAAIRDHSKSNGAANTKQAMQNARNVSAAQNVSVKDADTFAKNVSVGQEKMALEKTRHAKNPELEMAKQKEISQEIGRQVGKEQKDLIQKQSFDNNLQTRQQKSIMQNNGEGVRNSDTNVKHKVNKTPEEIARDKQAYQDRVAKKKADRMQRQQNGQVTPLKKKAQLKGQAQQQVVNKAVNESAPGTSISEVVSNNKQNIIDSKVPVKENYTVPKPEPKATPHTAPTTPTTAPTTPHTAPTTPHTTPTPTTPKNTPSWLSKNKKALAIGGGIAAVGGLGYGLYRHNKNKKQVQQQ